MWVMKGEEEAARAEKAKLEAPPLLALQQAAVPASSEQPLAPVSAGPRYAGILLQQVSQDKSLCIASFTRLVVQADAHLSLP